MEKKIYEVLGIKQYRNFVLLCKAKCNTFFKNDNYDNYLLRGYSYEDIIYLKKQFKINFIIHMIGTIGAISLIVIHLMENSLIKACFVVILFLLNGYSCMLQRYNLLKINVIIKKYFQPRQ